MRPQCSIPFSPSASKRRVRTLLLCLPILLLLSHAAMAQIEGREYEEAGKPENAEKVLKHFPEGSQAIELMVSMRDGVKLATSVFLPPTEGKLPVLFCKGFYGRSGMASYAQPCKGGNLVFVAQDSRGRGKSEGKGSYDPASFSEEVQDLQDTIEWIAKQPWSDGRIVMSGGSGNGVNPSLAILTGNPHLLGASVGNTSGVAAHWMFHNGVRRALSSWMEHRGLPNKSWPRPTLGIPDNSANVRYLQNYQVDPKTVYVAGGGWFDILKESSLDYFQALHDKMRVYITISPNSHVGAAQVDGKKWPSGSRPKSPPSLEAILDGKGDIGPSFVQYFVMGDVNQPGGPGNKWLIAETWPPAAEEKKLYLQAANSLSFQEPPADATPLSYVYNPEDPSPSIGGNATYDNEAGPRDQRPLAERKDLLRFETEALQEALTVVGPVKVRLGFASDAPDTLFVAKLVDIYPDGYEALILESAGMARFAEGLDGNTPLQAGQPYALAFDLGNTAIAFAPGHKIGLYLGSASASKNEKGKVVEAFEVHPNTFEPAKSASENRPATQTIFVSPPQPSYLLLPVSTQ